MFKMGLSRLVYITSILLIHFITVFFVSIVLVCCVVIINKDYFTIMMGVKLWLSTLFMGVNLLCFCTIFSNFIFNRNMAIQAAVLLTAFVGALSVAGVISPLYSAKKQLWPEFFIWMPNFPFLT